MGPLSTPPHAVLCGRSVLSRIGVPLMFTAPQAGGGAMKQRIAVLDTIVATVACLAILTGGGEQEAAVHESGISFVQAAAGGPSVTEAEHEVQEARAVEERAEQSVNAAQRRIKSKKKAAASQAKSLKKKMKAQKKKMKKVVAQLKAKKAKGGKKAKKKALAKKKGGK